MEAKVPDEARAGNDQGLAWLVDEEQHVQPTVRLPTVSRSSISSIMDNGSSSPLRPAAKRDRADLFVRCVA